MGIRSKISSWWQGLFQRRRLSLHSTRDNHEIWYTHISPFNIVMAFVAVITLLFTMLLTLLGYTPLLELLPGYRSEALKSRQNIIDNIIRLDSMERVINDMALYTDNITMILEGKTPAVESDEVSAIDSVSGAKVLVLPNEMDSILRAEMEGDSRYNIQRAMAVTSTPMVAPADGIIVEQYDLSEDRFGVDIAVAANERVMAAQRGVVIFTIWSPVSGYTVQILHSDSQITIYQNIADICVVRGDSVKAGEVIGYSAEAIEGQDSESRVIHFELWMDGKPVDPEKFIIF